MNLTIDRQRLLLALRDLQTITRGRHKLEILGGVRLLADHSQLRLTTTDLQTSITLQVESVVAEPDTVVVPIRRLTDVVRALPNGAITLTSDRDHLRVGQGSYRYRIALMGTGEFPAYHPPIGQPMSFLVGGKDLRRVLARTLPAASTDATRYVLNGVSFRYSGGILGAAATDGRRLSCDQASVTCPAGQEGDLIVPRKACRALLRVLGKEQVTVVHNGGLVSFRAADWKVSCQLVNGTYPNYGHVIPANKTVQGTAWRRDLVGAVRRARAAATDNPRSVRVALRGGRISLLENQSGEPFEMESLPISSGSGELTCNLNCDYLLDVLTALDGETVEFGGTDSTDPITIRQDHFLAVIVPMRG